MCLSSKAACRELMTSSALESPLALMTPFRVHQRGEFFTFGDLVARSEVQRQPKHQGQIAEAQQLEENAPAAAPLLGKASSASFSRTLRSPVSSLLLSDTLPTFLDQDNPPVIFGQNRLQPLAIAAPAETASRIRGIQRAMRGANQV